MMHTHSTFAVLGLVLALLAALIGCDTGGNGDDESRLTGPDGSTTLDLSGTWEGVWQSTVVPDDGTLVVTLIQSGTALSGELVVTGSPCVTTETVAGELDDDTVVFGTATGGPHHSDFTGTVASDGTAMDGTYAVTSGPCVGDRGTWSLTRVTAPVSR